MRLRRVLGLLLLVAGVVAWVLQARRTADEWVGVDLDEPRRPPAGGTRAADRAAAGAADRVHVAEAVRAAEAAGGGAGAAEVDAVVDDLVAPSPTAGVPSEGPTVDVPLMTAEVDDLTLIDGIGPKIASALAAAGLGTFAALADASDDELRAALRAAGARASATLPTWAAQARALAG